MSERDSLLARWLKLKQQSRDCETKGTPVDLSTVPPIESLTNESDMSVFLQPGVPAELLRAALHQAWRADPAIRDFVGIAESQWDFNDPAAMAGFGPLEPAMGAESGVRLSSAPTTASAGGFPEPPPDLGPRRDGQLDNVWLSGGQSREENVSLQPEVRPIIADGDTQTSDIPRRHGSALPKVS